MKNNFYIIHVGNKHIGRLDTLGLPKISISNKISVLSISTYNTKPILYRQLENSGIRVLNNTKDFQYNSDKIRLYLELLKDVKSEYSLLIDSLDVLILKDLDDEFIYKFESLNKDIIFAYDAMIFPSVRIEDESDLNMCLNTGIIFGRTKNLLDFYGKVYKFQKQYEDINKIYKISDQFWIRSYIAKTKYNSYYIDKEQQLIASIRNFYVVDGEIINTPIKFITTSTEFKFNEANEIKLVFCLPTCEPESFNKYLLPSIVCLRPIKDQIEFCICFQPPYTIEQIKTILMKFNGWNVKWFYKDYKYTNGRIPLMKMRNDCAMLEPDADYYALLDDDMKFLPGLDKTYSEAMVDFENDRNLGVVAFSDKISNFENYYHTNKGLVYRGGKYYGFRGLVPHKLMNECKTLTKYEGEDLNELIGGHQDKLCAMIRLATGQVGKQYANVPCLHQENRKVRGCYQYKWIDVESDCNSVVFFIRKYFRRDFSFDNSTNLFEDELSKVIYNKTENNKIQILTLDGRCRINTTYHSTARNEKFMLINNRRGKLSMRFKITRAEDYKEFTIMQIHSIDENRKNVPLIRISIIDKTICTTYKDINNINHYTKIDNFEVGKEYTITLEVKEDVISIQEGHWNYDNWATKMSFRYGLYTQTEEGIYEIQILDILNS